MLLEIIRDSDSLAPLGWFPILFHLISHHSRFKLASLSCSWDSIPLPILAHLRSKVPRSWNLEVPRGTSKNLKHKPICLKRETFSLLSKSRNLFYFELCCSPRSRNCCLCRWQPICNSENKRRRSDLVISSGFFAASVTRQLDQNLLEKWPQTFKIRYLLLHLEFFYKMGPTCYNLWAYPHSLLSFFSSFLNARVVKDKLIPKTGFKPWCRMQPRYQLGNISLTNDIGIVRMIKFLNRPLIINSLAKSWKFFSEFNQDVLNFNPWANL